jgi:ribosomal protein S18 acetylase RimI-like enzyme
LCHPKIAENPSFHNWLQSNEQDGIFSKAIYTQNGELIGRVAYTTPGNNYFSIRLLYIMQKFRHQGYGPILLRLAVKDAIDHGAIKILISTHNEIVQKMCEQNGFELSSIYKYFVYIYVFDIRPNKIRIHETIQPYKTEWKDREIVD